MELKKTIEVIEYNIMTNERRAHNFEHYFQAIGFIKRKEDKVKQGYTYTVCDINKLIQ